MALVVYTPEGSNKIRLVQLLKSFGLYSMRGIKLTYLTLTKFKVTVASFLLSTVRHVPINKYTKYDVTGL